MKAPSANPNPNNFSKDKEEGELSASSDDNEIPAGTATQLDGRTSALKLPAHVALVKKNVGLGKTGKSVSTSNPARFVGVASRYPVHPNHHNKFEKNRVPFVISFSDDDSGSDSEECRQGNAYGTKSETLGVAGSRRPPAALFAKVQMLPGNARNDTMAPRKASLSRTFVSSMTKIYGVSSKNGWPLLGKQRSHVKNINLLNKNKAEHEHGANQNVRLNSSKLQDLRQLIAIRENELKLKAAKQKEELASGSCRNNSATVLSNKATRLYREAPADFAQFELKEPDRKRLKISESHSCLIKSDRRQSIPDADSTLAPQKYVPDSYGQQILDNCSCCDKEIALGTTQWQKDEENRGSVLAANLPSAVKEDTAVIPYSSQCNRIVKLASPSARAANMPVETTPKKSLTVELRHPIETNHQPPSSSMRNGCVPNKARHVHNSSRSSELHEVRSGEKAIEPVSKDTYKTFLNNISIWNSLGKVNISGTSNMDIQALMEVEELQDKELEEAQEYRRNCEVEERNALKAYRKAQRAMMEANSRCSYLYRRRELYSVHLQSRMMDNPSMFCSSSVHDHLAAVPNSSNNMPEVDKHVVPSSRQMESKLYGHNQCPNDSSVRSANGALQKSVQHGDGDLASDPSSEPDTSDPQKDNAEANAVGSQSGDLNMSAEEGDETFPFDHETEESNLDHQRKEEI